MAPILLLVFALTLSLVVTRIGSTALTLTGLSQESARFQARSAFTGVGFTTTESEQVVNHPVRRRILMLLMLMGNAGIVTVMASLILGFVDTAGSRDALQRIGFLAAGLLLLCWLSRSKWVERRMNRLIRKALERWTDLDVRDYANLFKFRDGYSVSELGVSAGEWLADRSLAELALTSEGVLVLGIQRADGTYVGAPTGETVVGVGDHLIAYGRSERLKELDRRVGGEQGDRDHRSAVKEQSLLMGRGGRDRRWHSV
jgi:hypothetical protein